MSNLRPPTFDMGRMDGALRTLQNAERARVTLAAWTVWEVPVQRTAHHDLRAIQRVPIPTPPLARSRDGIHDLLDIATARATIDTVADLNAALDDGLGISGPAARRAIKAAATAPQYTGTVITVRQARQLLANPHLAVYDNPHTLLMCVYKRDKALPVTGTGSSPGTGFDRAFGPIDSDVRYDRPQHWRASRPRPPQPGHQRSTFEPLNSRQPQAFVPVGRHSCRGAWERSPGRAARPSSADRRQACPQMAQQFEFRVIVSVVF